MQHTHIEQIAESIGTAQSILETLSANRYSTIELTSTITEDKQVLNEYAQSALCNALEQLRQLSHHLDS